MAARCSGRINWDTLGDEAEEDAGELNYDYEWIVPDPGFGCLMNYPCSELFVLFLRLIGFGLFADVQETATSGRRRGGRLGLAGGVRSGRTGMGGGSGHGGQSTNGNGGEEGHGHAGVGGHADAGQAHHGYGYVLDAREGLGETLLDGRHGLAHQVRSIVNRAMMGGHGEAGGSVDELHVRGRARLGLTGLSRRCAPVTRWPPHLPTQGNPL